MASDPLIFGFSPSLGFEVYRSGKRVLRITDPAAADDAAARLLMFPLEIDGEIITCRRQRRRMARTLLRVGLEQEIG